MSNEMIPLEYANNLIFELEKAFWDERGKGARFRLTKVGEDFLEKNCLSKIETNEVPDIIRMIEEVLVEKKIIGKIEFDIDGRIFKLTIRSCIHKSIEAKMVEKGIEPFACFPANLIVLSIEKKLDRPVELAEIKLDEEGCHLLLVMFDKRPTL